MIVATATVAHVVAAVIIARSLPLASTLERLLVGLVVLQASITLAVLGTGLAGQLHPLGLAAVSVGWLASAVVLARRFDRAPDRLPALSGSGLMDGLAEIVRWPPTAILLLLTAASGVWRAALAIRLPPLDYDGFSYHLVTVIVWVQRQGIVRVSQRPWTDGYPAGGELITTWLAEFTQTSAFTTLTGLVGVPLVVVATAAVARSFGAGRRPAALAGLLLGLTPAVVLLGSTTYVDVLAVASVAAAWAIGMRALDAEGSRRRALLVLTGLAFGLAAGTKLTMLVPLGVLGLAILAVGLRRGSGLVTTVSILAPAALVGGYWYVRNLVTFGNPVWPFRVGPLPGLGTIEQLIVQVPKKLEGLGPLESLVASWTADPSIRAYSYDTRVGGLGVIWVPLLALGLVGVGILVRDRRRGSCGLLALVLAPALVTLAIMPMNWWPRLTLFVVVPFVALASVVLTRIPSRATLVVALALVLGAGWSLWVASSGGNFGSGELASLRSTASTLVADLAARRDLGLWRQCRGFAVIPSGSSVTVAEFNLVGLVPGPDWDRVLLDPPVGADPVSFATSVRALGADYLVARGESVAWAQADPATFEDLGEACRDAWVFRVRPVP